MKIYISEPLTGHDERQVFNDIHKLCQKYHHDSFLPHLNADPLVDPEHPTPAEVWQKDYNEVISSDLLIAYVGKPSLGVGGELEMARQNNVKIILWWYEGEKVSRLAKGNPAVLHQIITKDNKTFILKLEGILKEGVHQIDSESKVNYPFTPEGRTVEYVPKENKFMRLAKELADKSTCTKLKTGAVIVQNDEVVAKGSNTGKVSVDVCPREKLNLATGTGYEHCKRDCQQGGHAEEMAVKNAMEHQVDINGADLYLHGHWWCCEPCWQEMINAGISHVYLNRETRVQAEQYSKVD